MGGDFAVTAHAAHLSHLSPHSSPVSWLDVLTLKFPLLPPPPPGARMGRYGGVFIVMSYAWGALVDKVRFGAGLQLQGNNGGAAAATRCHPPTHTSLAFLPAALRCTRPHPTPHHAQHWPDLPVGAVAGLGQATRGETALPNVSCARLPRPAASAAAGLPRHWGLRGGRTCARRRGPGVVLAAMKEWTRGGCNTTAPACLLPPGGTATSADIGTSSTSTSADIGPSSSGIHMAAGQWAAASVAPWRCPAAALPLHVPPPRPRHTRHHHRHPAAALSQP